MIVRSTPPFIGDFPSYKPPFIGDFASLYDLHLSSTSSGLQEKQIFKDHNEIFQRRAFAWTPAQEREVQGQD